MSYENVVGGKLKLKGKALDVKAGGIKKKKKKEKHHYEQLLALKAKEVPSSEITNGDSEIVLQEAAEGEHGGGETPRPILEDHRTPAEKKYGEQRAKLEARRLAKTASKSHRHRIEEFNQYLANLSEHYDIPKVGPG